MPINRIGGSTDTLSLERNRYTLQQLYTIQKPLSREESSLTEPSQGFLLEKLLRLWRPQRGIEPRSLDFRSSVLTTALPLTERRL